MFLFDHVDPLSLNPLVFDAKRECFFSDWPSSPTALRYKIDSGFVYSTKDQEHVSSGNKTLG